MSRTGAGPGGPVLTGTVDRVREGSQRWLAAMLVAVLPWLISPGLVQPDTKLDLVVSPWRYLGRATYAWNEHTGIGELQNQAYGYLFPMGPLLGLSQWLGLPGWASQRLWWSLLLAVAFLGAERAARRLVGLAPVPALVAGLVYALSPRVLTVLAEISVEVWPYAVAPWLLVVTAGMVRPGAAPAERRSGAIRVGLLTVCLGGVNATVSLLALVPAGLWLLVAGRGRAVLRAWGWWLPAVVLGATWWLAPLLVLGRYSYPFLDHIETAGTTTAVASLVNVLRGANHWVAYILTEGEHPVWQSGWVLAQTPVAIVATTVVAALGLAGVLRWGTGAPAGDDGGTADRAHLRRWALLSILLGVVAMAAGRGGAVSGLLSGEVRELLDGALAPFRNVHKADLLVRLPVALGVASLLHEATRVPSARREVTTRPGWQRQGVVAGAVLALVGSLLPLWQGRVGDAWAYQEISVPWQQVAADMDAEHAAAPGAGTAALTTPGGATLVLPSARVAHQTWGRTNDEPLSALASSPVLSRAAAPLGHPGASRLLDAVDARSGSGRAQPALAAALVRSGVRRVVVRHDLDPSVPANDPERVEQTLSRSPGFELVRTRGSGALRISEWRVEGAGPATIAADDVVRVAGGPESWFELVEAGVIGKDARIALTAPDLDGTSPDRPPQVVTDTLRWRALNSGVPALRGWSPTLSAADPAPARTGTRDLAPGGQSEWATTRAFGELTQVSASSSAADPFADEYRGIAHGPAAALDGDPATTWVAGDDKPVQRLTLGLAAPREVAEVVVALPGARADLARVSEVTIVAGRGAAPVRRSRAVAKGARSVTVPVGVETDEVVVEIRGDGVGPGRVLAVTDVRLPGLDVRPRLVLPSLPDPGSVVVLTRDRSGWAGALAGEDPSDLLREVSVPAQTRRTVRALVRPVPGADAERLLDGVWDLSGSTRAATSASDPSSALRARPGAALDGDSTTQWVPDPAVARPVLSVDLGSRRTVDGIELSGGSGLVRVESEDGTWLVPSGGRLEIPRTTTRRLTLTFTRPPVAPDSWAAPEVTLVGVENDLPDTVATACGEAGVVEARPLTGAPGRTSRVGLKVEADRSSFLSGGPVEAVGCTLDDADGLQLLGGDTLLSVSAKAMAADVVVLDTRGAPAPATGGTREVGPWRETERRASRMVEVSAGPAVVLETTQGANHGWVARDGDGNLLERVTLDGWRQGFLLPEGGATTVTIDVVGVRGTQLALLLGVLGVLVLLGAAGVGRLHQRRRPPGDDEPVEPAAPSPEALGTGPGVAPGRTSSIVAMGVAVAAGLLVAGWLGAVAAILGALVPVRRQSLVAAGLLTLAGLGLTVLGVADQRSAGAWVGQVIGSVVIGVLVGALWRWPGERGAAPAPRPPSTTAGPGAS